MNGMNPAAPCRLMGEVAMQYIHLTLFDFAQRDIGVKEFAGGLDNPLIMAMLKLTAADQWDGWPEHDEVPWCSAALNFWCRYLRLPRSKSLLARSWLSIGRPIALEDAVAANDIVILKRGSGAGAAGPDNVTAPGHVGIFAGLEGTKVLLLGGNQGDQVSIARHPKANVIGVRRLL